MTKVNQLPSQEYLQSIFDYDTETGDLIWNARDNNPRFNSRLVGKIAGTTLLQGYIQIRFNKTSYKAHRLIWKWHYGVDPNGDIDHININSLDNRIENLRDVNDSDNNHNKGLFINNTSGTKGVSLNNGKWESALIIRGNKIQLGFFENKEDAVKARKEAEKQDWSHLETKNKVRERFKPNFLYLTECFDYIDGNLIWKVRPEHHFKSKPACNKWNLKFPYKVAGSKNNSGYDIVVINDNSNLKHRLIYQYLNKLDFLPTDMVVDHINGNTLDNRIENLRLVTKRENSLNCKKSISNKSGYTGVREVKKYSKWVASITIDYKTVHLGYFKTKEEAIRARVDGELQHFGEFARQIKK